MSAAHDLPAFPRVEPAYGDQGPSTYFGMSLRDYFAAKAMQALVTGTLKAAIYGSSIASDAYTIADEMLAERSK